MACGQRRRVNAYPTCGTAFGGGFFLSFMFEVGCAYIEIMGQNRRLPEERNGNGMGKQPARKIWAKAAELFDLHPELLEGLPHIEILGGRRMLIENHHGIVSYGDREIVINGGQVVIKVEGRDLRIRSITIMALWIEGEITNIAFIQ